MRYLLAKEGRAALSRLMKQTVLLAFDFDGTLAPIVTNRDRAFMRVRTQRLFVKLCEQYPCAVISGRSKDDVSDRLGDSKVKYVVGNHGVESDEGVDEGIGDIAWASPALEKLAAEVPGVELEDKRYSFAVHFRKAKPGAEALILEAIEKLPKRVKVIPGKQVVNVVPLHSRDKGQALLELCEDEGADAVLYVGDDVTDEDVFKLARVLTVRVGQSRTSAASYYLKDQREVDVLLALLVSPE